MKRETLIVLGISLMTATFCMAGYRNVTPENGRDSLAERTTAKTHATQVREAWEAVVKRQNGQEVVMRNMGDRFSSIPLERKKQIEIILTIPGAQKGDQVDVKATHSGKIGEKYHARLKVGDKGRVVIPFQMGTIGSHPVFIEVRGRTMGMMFMVKEPKPALSGVGLAREEAR